MGPAALDAHIDSERPAGYPSRVRTSNPTAAALVAKTPSPVLRQRRRISGMETILKSFGFRRGPRVRQGPAGTCHDRRQDPRAGDVSAGLAVVRARGPRGGCPALHSRAPRHRPRRSRRRGFRRWPGLRSHPRNDLPHPAGRTRQLGRRRRSLRVTTPARSCRLRDVITGLSARPCAVARNRCAQCATTPTAQVGRAAMAPALEVSTGRGRDSRGSSDPCPRVERMYESVVRIRGQLGELVSALDPDGVSSRAARELWAEFDRIERLGAAGKTLLARRIAASHQRDREGTRSAAESLARKSGTSTAAAKDVMDTSHRLSELPGVEGALRRGELSHAQAAAISSAAEADPSAEQRLLELAPRVSLAELREECARVKAAADPDPEATNRRIHAQRRLRHYRDGEGGWNLSARGTAQAGAAFLTVLNAITDAIFTAARREGRKEPVDAYAFDALMAMAEHAAGGDQPAPPATERDQHGHHAPNGSGELVRDSGAAVDSEPSWPSRRHDCIDRRRMAAAREARRDGGRKLMAASPGRQGRRGIFRPTGRRARCARCRRAAGPTRGTWPCCGSTQRRCAAAGSRVRNCAKSPESARSRSRWPAMCSARPS